MRPAAHGRGETKRGLKTRETNLARYRREVGGKIRALAEGFNHLNPSQVDEVFWLTATRGPRAEYPASTEHGGKWLLFVPQGNIDEMWSAVRDATEKGRLGGSAKVATKRPNPHASNPLVKPIIVYSYDSRDESDVTRIANTMRELGARGTMYYKEDLATFEGRYAVRGDRRISLYASYDGRPGVVKFGGGEPQKRERLGEPCATR